jgi:hypothetical protein
VGLHSLDEIAKSLRSTRALDSAVAKTVACLVICFKAELLGKSKLFFADVNNADDARARFLCPSGGNETDRSRAPDDNCVTELYLKTAYSRTSNRTGLNEGCASEGKIIGKKNEIADIYRKIFGKSTVTARAVVVIIFTVSKLAYLAGRAFAAGEKREYSRAANARPAR